MADDMGWVRRRGLRGFMRMVPLGSSRRIRAIGSPAFPLLNGPRFYATIIGQMFYLRQRVIHAPACGHYTWARPRQRSGVIESTRRSVAMTTKIVLDDADIPSSWYNILADMPHPPQPPLHPATQQPVGPNDLTPLFAMDLITQEVSRERFIAIPDVVREIYSLWRPTPLYRAQRLERVLGTPARIYYKYEGV